MSCCSTITDAVPLALWVLNLEGQRSLLESGRGGSVRLAGGRSHRQAAPDHPRRPAGRISYRCCVLPRRRGRSRPGAERQRKDGSSCRFASGPRPCATLRIRSMAQSKSEPI